MKLDIASNVWLLCLALLMTMPVLADMPPTDQLQPAPLNPNFEAAGEVGATPSGWRFNDAYVEAGFAAELSTQECYEGNRCASLVRHTRGGDPNFAILTQLVDPEAYREQRIRLSAALKAESGSRAQMMLRVDRPGGRRGTFDNMSTRPVTSTSWQRAEIVGEVPADAERIIIAAMLPDTGRLWIDDVRLEVLGDAAEGKTRPRALTDRGLQNTVALTHLLGYLRYFHPSDEVETADWPQLARTGLEQAESAVDAHQLADRLQTLIRPVAPTVQVFESASPPPPIALPGGSRRVAWQHLGLGTEDPRSIYDSKRVFEPTSEEQVLLPRKRKLDLPQPGDLFEAELGGGVSCRVPLALYADDEHTLPRLDVEATHAPLPPGFTAAVDDRTTRLSTVMLAWAALQHFYPYFDVVDTDWPAALEIALKQAAVDDDATGFLATLRTLVVALHDGHGRVGGPGQSPFAAPPFHWRWVENSLVINAVAEGEERLALGDVVLTVDGVPASDALAEAAAVISSSTDQWRRWRALQELLTGDNGSMMRLQLRRVGQPPFEVEISRDRGFLEVPQPPRPALLEKLAEGILYVDLDGLSREQLTEALPRLAAAKGVVFDLRGYPNGGAFALLPHLTSEPLSSAQWHIPTIVLPDRRDLRFAESSWPVEPAEPRLPDNIVFLTDGRAISAAETILGIVEHYGLGIIVGAATAGTNGNINTLDLPADYRVVFTGMKVLKHDGSRHHGVGILPDVPATATIRGVATGRDEVLEVGIEVLTAGPLQ